MIRNRMVKALPVIMLLIISSCTTVGTIYTDFDPVANFQSYNTFSWTSVTPVAHLGSHDVTSRTDRNIIEEIRSNLTAKGYRYVNKIEDADLGVSISVGALDRVEFVENPLSTAEIMAGWRWAYRYGPEYSIQNYTDGTLAIDFVDLKTRSPIWHGRGTKRLSRAEINADDDREAISEAVTKILASFPAK
jgi:hypothetical protein